MSQNYSDKSRYFTSKSSKSVQLFIFSQCSFPPPSDPLPLSPFLLLPVILRTGGRPTADYASGLPSFHRGTGLYTILSNTEAYIEVYLGRIPGMSHMQNAEEQEGSPRTSCYEAPEKKPGLAPFFGFKPVQNSLSLSLSLVFLNAPTPLTSPGRPRVRAALRANVVLSVFEACIWYHCHLLCVGKTIQATTITAVCYTRINSSAYVPYAHDASTVRPVESPQPTALSLSSTLFQHGRVIRQKGVKINSSVGPIMILSMHLSSHLPSKMLCETNSQKAKHKVIILIKSILYLSEIIKL